MVEVDAFSRAFTVTAFHRRAMGRQFESVARQFFDEAQVPGILECLCGEVVLAAFRTIHWPDGLRRSHAQIPNQAIHGLDILRGRVIRIIQDRKRERLTFGKDGETVSQADAPPGLIRVDGSSSTS